MKVRTKIILVAAIFSLYIGSFARADLAERINGIISSSLQQKVRFSIHIIKADSALRNMDIMRRN